MTECNAVALFENVSPSVYEASELLEDWLGGITWDSERNERLRAALLAVVNGVEANPHRLWEVPPLTFTEQQVEWLADVLTPKGECDLSGLLGLEKLGSGVLTMEQVRNTCKAPLTDCPHPGNYGRGMCWGHSQRGRVWDGRTWALDKGQACQISETSPVPCM